MPNEIDLNSRSVQDYLKALYKLQRDDAPVATNALAARLQVAPASATAMIKKLAEAGLAEHIPYRGCRLTEAGRKQALRMVRRHRIIEQFLQQVLHYGWDEVDEEAEVLEHAVSDKLVERMWQVLGKPAYDPHGSPIPTADGQLPEQQSQPLTQVREGERVCVRRICEQQPQQLRRLEALGLAPGAQLILEAVAPEQVRIRLGGHVHTLPHTLAEAIQVSYALSAD